MMLLNLSFFTERYPVDIRCYSLVSVGIAAHLPSLPPLPPPPSQVDIWGGLGADCYVDSFNYMTRAYATSVIPIAMMVAIWFVWGLRRLCVRSEQIERQARIFSQHTEASLLLSYVVGDADTMPPPRRYAGAITSAPIVVLIASTVKVVTFCNPQPQTLPTVVSVQFKSLRCSELEGLGVRYLLADSSIDCDSPEYDNFVADIVWLLAVYLCVPLAYLGLLYRVSGRLYTPEKASDNDKENEIEAVALRLKEENDPELRPLKFLYKGYRLKYW